MLDEIHVYANLKYFRVTASLPESYVWNHRNYGAGVQLDFVTSFCREYGATPGCCWTKKEPELQNWCSPRTRRVRGGKKVFRFSGRFLGTQHHRGTLLHILKDLCSVLESWKAVPGFTCYMRLDHISIEH